MRTLTIAVIIAITTAVLPHATRGATFSVNSTTDDTDITPGDGVCMTAAHTCTLRAAILEANTLAGPDTITLPAGRFALAIRGGNEDAGVTGDLDITDDLVINGAGEAATIIDGKRIDRVFDVHTPAQVTLSNLTITNGQPPAAMAAGGLLNDGTVTLTAVTFLQNHAGRGDGWAGGLVNLGAATLAHVTFQHNRAGDAYANIPHTYAGGDDAGSVGGMWNIGTATLSDVTFRANRAGDGSHFQFLNGGDIGGMLNEGHATLTNVTFSANRAGDGTRGGVDFYPGTGGVGGGMENDGTATLTKVSFESNRAGHGGSIVYPTDAGGAGDGGRGGGMVNYGSATLTDISFVANRAGHGGAMSNRSYGLSDGGIGGGMYNGGVLTLTNATFDRNRAGYAYGGVGEAYNGVGAAGGGMFDEGDTTTLTNVTMTRNQAGNSAFIFYGYNIAGDGGGLYTSSATLTNVTLALNRAGRSSRGGHNGTGDQIAGAATLTNTIVFGSGESCSGVVVSTGHNLESGTSCGFTAAGDLSATVPRLDQLKNNGGFTQTMALLPGSPAIDAGDNAACPATDQRGVTRPQGAACDIGAYEVQP